MKKVALAFLFGAALASTCAHAIVFTATTYTTGATAMAGSASDSDSGTSPPAPLVLKSTAHVDTATDSAFADATADNFFLAVTSEVKSSLETSTAVGNAGFNGDFAFPAGPCRVAGCANQLLLSIRFDAQGDIADNGTTETLLAVTLVGDGVSLFDKVFSAPGPLPLLIDVPFGTHLGNLDITLTNTSDAEVGNAFGLTSASFGIAAVPEPATWIALAAGLFVLSLLLRRAHAS